MSSNIYIELKQTQVSPGAQIKGTIFINIKKNGQSPKLTFKGTEFVEFSTQPHIQTGQSTKINPTSQTIKNKYDIIKKTLELGKKMKKGKYYFPISFIIPSNSPSSFEFVNSGGTRNAYVRYRLIVTCGKDKLEEPLTIVRDDVSDTHNIKTIDSVKSFFCLNKGQIKLEATMAQTKKKHYYPGDKVKVLASIDTTASKVDVKSIKGVVELKISLEAKNQKSYFTQECAQFTAKGVPKGETVTFPIQFELNAPEHVSSTAGMMITATYLLKVQTLVNACGSGKGGNFCQPLVIGRRKEESRGDEKVKKDWNPKRMDLKNFYLQMEDGFRPVILKLIEKTNAARGKDFGNTSILNSSNANMVQPVSVVPGGSSRR